MARRLRKPSLENRTQRLKLEQRAKPYWFAIAPGISLGYRAGPSSWNVRAADGKGSNWIKSFAIADDHEAANGISVLDFWQACDKAKQLARGGNADAGRPATVAEALDDYADDLRVRGGRSTNASHPRYHLTPQLLARPVGLLTVKELRSWRNGLVKLMKASSVNRVCTALKACLNMAADHDDRIANNKTWRIGLAAIPEADDTESNLVLTDQQRRDVIASAYAISDAFGLYTEVHAATGARSSQIALLNVGDLHAGAKPLLMVPSSLKGGKGRVRTRKPMPISAGLAMRLLESTTGRSADEPLLLLKGRRWNADKHRLMFTDAARVAGLPATATIYCLRHTAITHALLAGVPVRLVASSYDTSVAMIEKTYSKNITDHGDEMMRRVALDIDAVADDNVVPLARR